MKPPWKLATQLAVPRAFRHETAVDFGFVRIENRKQDVTLERKIFFTEPPLRNRLIEDADNFFRTNVFKSLKVLVRLCIVGGQVDFVFDNDLAIVDRQQYMTKAERQSYILACVQTNGRVSQFGCTEDTICKDFQELSGKGMVLRFHGGVEQMETPIAPEVGTTNQKIVEALPSDFTATVAAKLCEFPNVEVIMPGGD